MLQEETATLGILNLEDADEVMSLENYQFGGRQKIIGAMTSSHRMLPGQMKKNKSETQLPGRHKTTEMVPYQMPMSVLPPKNAIPMTNAFSPSLKLTKQHQMHTSKAAKKSNFLAKPHIRIFSSNKSVRNQ